MASANIDAGDLAAFAALPTRNQFQVINALVSGSDLSSLGHSFDALTDAINWMARDLAAEEGFEGEDAGERYLKGYPFYRDAA